MLSGNKRRAITPEYLEQAILYLRKNKIKIISLDNLQEELEMKDRSRFVIFTFDDGYLDNFTYAYPIFKKLDVPFTIYITTDFPDNKAFLWWDALEILLLKNTRVFIKLKNKTLVFNCSTLKQKENTFVKIRSLIISFKKEELLSCLNELFLTYRIDPYQNIKMTALNWEQIQALSRDPLVTIGAHSVSHPVFSNLGESSLRHEILDSKHKIESYIGKKVKHFSYPFGTPNEIGQREVKVVQESSFSSATTAIPGNIFLKHKHYMYSLPRIPISGEREGRDAKYLSLFFNGTIACFGNKFKVFSKI